MNIPVHAHKGQRGICMYKKRTILCLSLEGKVGAWTVTPQGIVRDRQSAKRWLNGERPAKMEPLQR